VRDVVRAYRDILRGGEPCEVYNICSGKSVSVGEILQMLLKISGREPAIIESADRARGSDVEEVRGDFGKIQQRVGWMPVIPLARTLEDMIDYWRNSH